MALISLFCNCQVNFIRACFVSRIPFTHFNLFPLLSKKCWPLAFEQADIRNAVTLSSRWLIFQIILSVFFVFFNRKQKNLSGTKCRVGNAVLQRQSNPAEDKSFLIYLVYNGDTKADRNGARLPAWRDHQSASISPGGDSCPLADKIAQWKWC